MIDTTQQKNERLERGVVSVERDIAQIRATTNSAMLQLSTDMNELRSAVSALSSRVFWAMSFGGVGVLIVIILVGFMLGMVVERGPAGLAAAPAAPSPVSTRPAIQVAPSTPAAWLAHVPEELR